MKNRNLYFYSFLIFNLDSGRDREANENYLNLIVPRSSDGVCIFVVQDFDFSLEVDVRIQSYEPSSSLNKYRMLGEKDGDVDDEPMI